MFTVLNFEAKKGKKLIGNKKIVCKTTQVREAQYYIITVITHNNKVNWKKIKKIAGDSTKYFLAPPNVVLPNGITRYDSTAYRQHVLFNTFIKAIEKCNPRNLSLGLLDADARYCNLLMGLLKRAATVTVFTLCKDAYEKSCDTAYRETGSAPMLTDDIYMLGRCTCVFSPTNFNTFNMAINEYLFGYSGFNLTGDDIELPSPFCSEIPKDIDQLDYAAALSERCYVNELNSLSAKFLRRQGKKISVLNLQCKISSLT
ncbi:MAG: hypothetical protein PHV07_07965 [Oscillospiraceae bacterium]|nr:hypothetical protein [Oscillospiraceae bacterium]